MGKGTEMSSGSEFLAHLQGAQVLHQLLRTGHPQQDRADPLTAETPRWGREGKRELVVNSEHLDFRGVSEEEGPLQKQTSLWFGSF